MSISFTSPEAIAGISGRPSINQATPEKVSLYEPTPPRAASAVATAAIGA